MSAHPAYIRQPPPLQTYQSHPQNSTHPHQSQLPPHAQHTQHTQPQQQPQIHHSQHPQHHQQHPPSHPAHHQTSHHHHPQHPSHSGSAYQQSRQPTPNYPQAHPDSTAQPQSQSLHLRGTMMPHHNMQAPVMPMFPQAIQNIPRLPEVISKTYGTLRYRIEIPQQPVRARMCGFGDKDRRPITPPPMVRLIIEDAATGQEISPEQINSSHFVLLVDLIGTAGEDLNLVKSNHTANPAASISAASACSYPPPPEQHMVVRASHYQMPQAYGQPGAPVMQAQPYGATQAGPSFAGYPPNPHASYQQQQPGYPPQGYHAGPQYQQPPSTYTRNLIGSLAVNAFKLKDEDDKLGFWFILQDLSIRTEGMFRLHFRFFDIGNTIGTVRSPGNRASPSVGSASNGNTSSTSANNNNNNGSNTASSPTRSSSVSPNANGGLATSAPLLASNFTDSFEVHTAKKFPGMIESTPLSKCFALQGIKIPVRKDGGKELVNGDEYANDDL